MWMRVPQDLHGWEDGPMRWQRLFEDLGAQQEALERSELASQIAESTRAERGQVEVVHRLTADLGRHLRFRVRGLGWVEGQLESLGPDWLLLSDASGVTSSREVLCPLAAVVAVEGLTGRADPRPPRLDLRHGLRALSRDRARVQVYALDGEYLGGTIDRVLADHLDLSRHADDEPRRAGAVRGVVSVPFDAIALIARP